MYINAENYKNGCGYIFINLKIYIPIKGVITDYRFISTQYNVTTNLNIKYLTSYSIIHNLKIYEY